MRRAKLIKCVGWADAVEQITKRAQSVQARLDWVKGDDLRQALEDYHAHLVQMRRAAKNAHEMGQPFPADVAHWWDLTPDTVRSRHIRKVEAAKFGGYPLQVFGKIL